MATEREVDAIAFDDMSMEAMRSSQDELMAEAMGATLPEGGEDEGDGDRSLEAMGDGPEGRGDEEDEGLIEAEALPEGGAEAPERDAKGQFVPSKPGNRHEAGILGALKEERAKRQAIESSFEAYKRDTDARFAALQAPKPAVPPAAEAPAQPADAEPDPYLRPDDHRAWQGREMDRRVQAAIADQTNIRVRGSFEEAGRVHGQLFQDAFAAADALDLRNPQSIALLNHIRQSTNPGQALVDWHRSALAAREIGSDPNAYKAKVEAEMRAKLAADPEFRKQLVAETRGVRQGQGSPENKISIPPSLNGVQSGASHRAGSGTVDTSQRGLFAEAISGL